MAYSTIISKKCKCGCGKMPTLGFQGYNMNCREDLKQAKIKRQQSKQQLAFKEKSKTEKKQIKRSIKSQVRTLQNSESNVSMVKGVDKSKSELMKECDRVFSLFIRNRDARDGWVTCPLCHKKYGLDQKTYAGDLIIQNLHFIPRSVYSLRYSEDNCIAGCTWCNKDMSDRPKDGTAYLAYKKLMIEKFGEDEVAIMEVAHRKINMLETQMLKNILEHYSITT